MPDATYNIPGNNRIPGYDSTLEIVVDDKYEAFSKEIPDPTPHGEGVITWFNNFGIKDKSTGEISNVPYTVTLQALPKGSLLFVYYDDKPNEMPTQPAGQGKVMFSLSVGDPPTGSYP